MATNSNPKHWSGTITDGRDRAPARSMLKAIGFSDDDLRKPIVGVAHMWIETMPCNFNHRDLAVKVKEGIRAAGATPMEFNTISISDGVTMGTEGMKASLVSRELIADSIELVGRGYMFDAVIAIVGCDKTIPAGAMGLIRLNVPGMILYSGSIAPGRFGGRDVTIQDVFEAVGQHVARKISDSELLEIENVACPGAGACGAQYTANTMAMVMEFIGLAIHGKRKRVRSGSVKGRCRVQRRESSRGTAQPRDASERDSDAKSVRECDRLCRGYGRINECGAAFAGNGKRGWGRVVNRRFRFDQQPYSVDRRSEAGWTVQCDRPWECRRHRSRRSPIGRRRIDRWISTDGFGFDSGRGS